MRGRENVQFRNLAETMVCVATNAAIRAMGDPTYITVVFVATNAAIRLWSVWPPVM